MMINFPKTWRTVKISHYLTLGISLHGTNWLKTPCVNHEQGAVTFIVISLCVIIEIIGLWELPCRVSSPAKGYKVLMCGWLTFHRGNPVKLRKKTNQPLRVPIWSPTVNFSLPFPRVPCPSTTTTCGSFWRKWKAACFICPTSYLLTAKLCWKGW